MSSDAIIVAEGLSKQYSVAAIRSRHDTIRDQVTHGLKGLFRRHAARSAADFFWALKDVGFSIREGEVVGLIGGNGAGKSTLLKILSRITHPTSGTVTVRGRVASLLEVGTGFQPELSGRENVYLSGAILGMRKAEIARRFDEIVDFSGIERFIDTPVKRYSSGMYVRLAFAVAAHLEPEIMFIDEVLAVGDVGFQRKCLAKMENVARGGRTIVFVSHNLAAVRALCPRSLFLRRGSLAWDGPSAELIARYLAEYEPTETRPPRADISADATFVDGSQDYLLHPKDQQTTMTQLCGERLVLEFEVTSPKPLEEMTAGVVIASGNGDPLVGMSSKVQCVRARSNPSCRWTVRCDMGELPLNAGTYLVHVYVGNGATDVARFSNAFELKIGEHDVFGWGNSLPPSSSWGPMYWAPTWHIRSLSAATDPRDLVTQ